MIGRSAPMWVAGLIAAVAAGCVFAGPPTTLRAPPDLLSKVGFEQKLGATVPVAAEFRDTRGATVRLGALFDDKPTLLVPGYYGCVNLCGAVRAGVAHAVAKSGFKPGRDFNVVLVSIDPDETPRIAAATQHHDAGAHPAANVARWHYLTASEAAIRRVTRSIGFRYYHDARNGQYDHDAGVVLLTPQGKITQYLFGVEFAPQTLRLALVGASQGRIGNLVDHFLLLCCNYDPSTGRYSLVIHRIMQALGATTALVLVGLVVFLRRSETRGRELRARETGGPS
ncbi:MAG: SCO family protein [Rhodanobacteraceae bacterium]